uniref:Uncharacterized protein n=1 Tax=Rhizophora mucronata TaxID=61149 RepID=A0A2P2QHG9_RHIMU
MLQYTRRGRHIPNYNPNPLNRN